ncbi:MAG TPA: redoxin domain-containing protein [Bacteroidia bacterium]|nr:redoxin domain-containing protein [Bacteroidia bacterium]
MKYKILFAILILIAIYSGYRAYQIIFYTPDIKFEELSLKTLNNKKININPSTLKSSIIIFFQTRCAPCVQEIKLFQKNYSLFRFTSLYFISDESPEKILSLKKRFHLDSLNFLISTESLQSIGIQSFPTTYIIKNGKIIETHKGTFIDETNFEDELFHIKEMLE